jgi:1-acyl-sn-glycerol-3-phosphate acyltransferase
MTASTSEEIQRFVPPSRQEMRRFMAVGRWWFNPEFLGLWEHDVSRPALFVGNHTLFGITDAPLMIEHLYTQYGVMLRGLGDRGHFNVPWWGDLLVKHGMVLGSPENCSALMRAGENILVFPGGAREVMRRKGEAYQLIWKKRAGFARLAIEHGYDIVPFGSVGPDESYRILWDANDILNTRWLRTAAERSGVLEFTRDGDFIPPVALGLGPTLIPKPQRYYFGFGARISTEQLKGSQQDPDAVWALREQVATAVKYQIDRLQAYRQEDRLQNWSFVRRRLAPLAA